MMLKPEQSPTFTDTCPGAEAQRQVFFSSTHQEPSGSLFLPASRKNYNPSFRLYLQPIEDIGNFYRKENRNA
jgi:hypothetical protein